MADLHQRLLDATGPLRGGEPDLVPRVNARLQALRTVITMHAPVETVVMAQTDEAGEWEQRAFEQDGQLVALDGNHLVCFAEKTPTDWPCNTIRVVAEHLGVATDG